jgi:hypothetical protein
MKNYDSANTLNVWHYKPWWCQPWSILLTGMIGITTTWLLWHTIWLSIVVAIPISIWWVYFLLIYPRIASEMMSQGISDRGKT